MKSEIKQMIMNGIFFIIILILTYVVILSKIDLKEFSLAFKETNLFFVLIAFILATNNIIFEAINLKRNFKLFNDNVKFIRCLKYSTIGFFFNSITPASSGGQPMQVYAMTKDGIKFSHGASSLFVSYVCYMIASVCFAIVAFILNYNYFNQINVLKYLVYIGLIANIVLVSIILIAMFSKKTTTKVLKFVVSIVEKINQEKAQKLREKIESQLDRYYDSAHFIISNKWSTLKTFIISFLQVVSINSVTYFVFRALGYNEYSYIQLLMLQIVVYISVSTIPLPGTIGVSETGFAVVYNFLFPTAIVETGMILSRGLSFYLLVIITGLILITISLVKKIKQRK